MRTLNQSFYLFIQFSKYYIINCQPFTHFYFLVRECTNPYPTIKTDSLITPIRKGKFDFEGMLTYTQKTTTFFLMYYDKECVTLILFSF